MSNKERLKELYTIAREKRVNQTNVNDLLNKINMLEQRIQYLESDLEHFNRKYDLPTKKESSFSDIFDFPKEKPKRNLSSANVYVSQIESVHFNLTYDYKNMTFNKYFLELNDIEGMYIINVRVDEIQPQVGNFIKYSIIDGTIKSFKIFDNQD